MTPRPSGPSSTRISASATGSARSPEAGDGPSPPGYARFTSCGARGAIVASTQSRRRSSRSMKSRLPLALAVMVLAVAVPASSAAAKTISMSGSTSVAPLAAKLAKGYLKAHPHSVSFRLAQGGSDVGVADVAAGRVTIGNSSRDPKGSDPGGLVWSRIARDAICIATNANNPVAGLTQGQVQAIFSGQVRNWDQVPGAGASGPIDIVVRTAASGTQDAFQKIFMGS